MEKDWDFIIFLIAFLSVRPPKKSWKNITNLSGGEKTLSSLALVFALHYYRPTPLYVMDEIDAALDFKNVSIVGYYIKVSIGIIWYLGCKRKTINTEYDFIQFRIGRRMLNLS